MAAAERVEESMVIFIARRAGGRKGLAVDGGRKGASLLQSDEEENWRAEGRCEGGCPTLAAGIGEVVRGGG